MCTPIFIQGMLIKQLKAVAINFNGVPRVAFDQRGEIILQLIKS
jgi:hypothetical protein